MVVVEVELAVGVGVVVSEKESGVVNTSARRP